MESIQCDVIVVGAGPGGSAAAKYAALGGLDVILIEKRSEIGSPLRCAEGVSRKWLSEIGVEPDPSWICAEILGTRIISPSGNILESDERNEDGTGRGYVLERHLFDKALAKQAADAGARIMMRTACRGVVRENGKLNGIKADSMGKSIEIHAKCIIAADGFESQTARWAGIDTSLETKDIDTCIQYRMTNIDIDTNFCEFIVGSAAPGGYIWIFPKGEGTANVGIGVQAAKCVHGADPKYHLDKHIANDPRLSKGQILEISGGGVSTCPGIKEATADNLMIVGDAARVINPLTGGGIHQACVSGMHAGKTAAECAKNGNFSKAALEPYQKLLDKEAERFKRNFVIKEWYSGASDDILDEIIDAIRGTGIKKMKIDSMLDIIRIKMPSLFESIRS